MFLRAPEFVEIEAEPVEAAIDDVLNLLARWVEQERRANRRNDERDRLMVRPERSLESQRASEKDANQQQRNRPIDERPVDDQIDRPEAITDNRNRKTR